MVKLREIPGKARRSLWRIYAGVKYDRMAREAERYHAASPNHSRVAVITHPSHPDRLLYLNKAGLSRLMRDNPQIRKKKCSFKTVCNGAWYFTAGPEGRGMDPLARAARRRAFMEAVSAPGHVALVRRMRKAERKRRLGKFKGQLLQKMQLFRKGGEK